MNEVNLPAIEPVTDEDVDEAIELITDGAWIQPPVLIRLLEQDRRRVAERQAARPLEKIDRDESYGRSYIPVAPGWEVQTKGKGSTFRLCEPSGDRLAVPDSPYLHATIERMALAIHAHRVATEEEVERLRAEVLEHKREAARLTDVLLSKHGGEPLQLMDELDDARAEVAALKADLEFHVGEVKLLYAACAQMREALKILDGFVEPRPSESDWRGICSMAREIKAALSTDAGKGWIDATGALK